VLWELEESCRIVIDVGVPEIVKLAAEGVLNELLLLGTVLGLMHIELSRGILELVGCGS